MELTPSFIRHHIIGTTLRHCMDVQSYDVMSGSCMGYVYIDTDTMEPVQYGPAWIDWTKTIPLQSIRIQGIHGRCMDIVEHLGSRYGVMSDLHGFPIQYGPVMVDGEMVNSWFGSDPIQECDGCMTGFNPDLLTVRESGSVMCAECCAVEDGD